MLSITVLNASLKLRPVYVGITADVAEPSKSQILSPRSIEKFNLKCFQGNHDSKVVELLSLLSLLSVQ